MKKPDVRKLNPREAVWLQIANFLKTGIGTQRQAAYIFQVSLRGVKKIWKQYKEGGVKALKAKKRGPHMSTSRRSKAQTKEIAHQSKGVHRTAILFLLNVSSGC